MPYELTPIQKKESQGNFLSLREILTVVFKHKRTIIVVFLLITFISLIIPFFMTPIYEADSSLLVKIGREHMLMSEVGDVTPQIQVDIKTLVDPEVAILTSRDLMQRVIQALGINVIYPDLANDPPESMSPLEASILQFQDDLEVEQQGDSNVIIVKFQHEVPQISAKAVNFLGDFWKELHLKVFSAPQAPFLHEQAEMYRTRLEQSETRLQQFKQEHGISSFSEQKRLILEQQQALDISHKTTQNEIQGLTTKIDSITKQLKTIPKEIPLSTVNDERRVIDDTKSELLSLKRKEQELSARYQDTSRILIELRKEIALMQSFISEQEEELGDTVTLGRNPVYQQLELEMLSAKSQHAALHTQDEVLTKQLKELDNQIGNLSQLQKEFDALERKVTNDQENLTRYMEKVEAAKISQKMDKKQIANVSVIQAASVPVKPIKPKKGLIAGLGVILGALASISLAFLMEALQSSYTRPEQVSNDLDLPVLVSISHKG